MEPVHEADLGPEAASGRDRGLEGRPPLPRIVGDEDGIAIRVQPMIMVQEGKSKRNASKIIGQLARQLPMITAVATSDRPAMSAKAVGGDQDGGVITRVCNLTDE